MPNHPITSLDPAQHHSARFTTRSIQRYGKIVAGLLVCAVLAAVLLAGLSEYRVDAAPTQADKHVYLVVQLDDQARVVRRVQFTDAISGLAALQLSGLEVVSTETAFGPAVCSIEGIGCPASDCFCGGDRFWNYSYWDGAGWQSYSVGAGASVISQTGAVEGWRWGEFGAHETPAPPSLAADRALSWLQRQQGGDGGYGGMGPSVETLLALNANHMEADQWRLAAGSPSLADYLQQHSPTYAHTGPGAAGKLAVALPAAGACIPVNVLTPQSYYSPTVEAYSPQSGPNSWAILGALALEETVPPSALAMLKAQRLSGGGWEWAPGWGADTNTTALALQALIAAGEPISSQVIVSGVAFLRTAQNRDGGFPYAPGPDAESDANSTAYVIQALTAVGEDPTGPSWTISNTTPISYLMGMQLPDGSIPWQSGGGPNLLATQQAIPALLGRSYPLQQQAPEDCPVLFLPALTRE